MKFNTTRFGEIEINEEEIINFTQGPYGFENETEFILIEDKETDFFWLQSISNPDLAFIVTEPWLFYQDYEFEIEGRLEKELKLESKDEVLIINIIVVPEDPKEMTMNLKAPIIVNEEERLAKQIILEGEEYPVKYKLFNKEEQTISA